MKIGFDAKRAFQNTRGLGNYSRNLISGLMNSYPENQYYLFGQRPTEPDCVNWFNPLENKITRVDPGSHSSLQRALWRSFGMGNEIREHDLDIYHGLSHEIPFKAGNNRTKFVVTIHDLLFLRFKRNFSWIDRQIYASKIKYSCRHADLILAVSEQTKQDLINLLDVPDEKIVVNYQSCSGLYYHEQPEMIRKAVQQRYHLPDDYYLFVGALVKHKNIARVIEALSLLPEELRHTLVIVGKETDYKKDLLQVVKKHRLTDQVQFVNYIQNEDLPAVYQQAKLLIWPSLFEGFGIPIIEALFSKLPVITSNTGCFPEVGGEGACYVNPESAPDIAAAIRSIITNPDRYAQMQQKGYVWVQKFHIKNTTAHLMDLYSQLANIG